MLGEGAVRAIVQLFLVLVWFGFAQFCSFFASIILFPSRVASNSSHLDRRSNQFCRVQFCYKHLLLLWFFLLLFLAYPCQLLCIIIFPNLVSSLCRFCCCLSSPRKRSVVDPNRHYSTACTLSRRQHQHLLLPHHSTPDR
ncbi:hypothetical protein BD289DRAFT_268615 [Coniella lustricola]|uniref:Uncharacterized protein n=1 Tax=Coniella lustricola TaxID=2025994 RepID=A0A2T3A730_9PEZI|nr:hypothetical protein BD289DRAFT_268615 [Coniella lustricola]